MEYNIDNAIKAAIDAGKAIINIYENESFDVEMKSDNSPLTKADKKAHEIIMSYLDKTDIPVLSEEGKHMDYSERKGWSKFWLVDPLDGTKEFINRNGEFTVNIALIEDQKPIAGVIYVPVSKEIYLGIVDESAWKMKTEDSEIDTKFVKNNAKKISAEKYSKGKFIVVGSRSHMNEATKAFISELEKNHGETEIMSRGSSLKLCMVAEGKAHAYPRFAPTMEWDTGAGHAVAKASGAVVINKETGNELIYNKEDLLNPWFLVKPVE